MTQINPTRIARGIAFSILALIASLTITTRGDAAITAYTIQIDASTTQPVGTGLVPVAAGDHVLVIAEGSIQPFSSSSWVGNGWFGADGQTRLNRGGQPVADGMPYGALIGGSDAIGNFQFLGSHGGYRTQPIDVGQEFAVALNMSDSDLASSNGLVTVTLVHIPAGDPDIVETILDASSGAVVGTGLISSPGDDYMVLAYGAGKVVGTNDLDDGWFTASGQVRFNRSGQPFNEGPFGGLYGSYTGGTTGFYVGEAGSFSAQPADSGDELFYLLNMSATDAASMSGRILIRTIRIAESTSAVGEQSGEFGTSVSSFPNPMAEDTRIRFALPSGDSVKLRIYDAEGRWVRNLAEGSYGAGEHLVAWDGRTDDGQRVSSGTYFYQLSTRDGSKTGRLVVTR